MGFGFLFIGYLLTFLLYLTLQALGFGSLALLGGYALMLYALTKLCRFHASFSLAKWSLIPLLLTGIYRLLQDADTLFLWNVAFAGDTVAAVMDWVEFCLSVLFQFALLYGIRMLADGVELKKISAAAMRNTIVYGIYAALYIVGNLSFAASFRQYLTFSTVLFNIAWLALNLLLIVSCAKNICPAGDEEVTPRRSRFEWINRMGDAYEESHTKLREQARHDGEELRRRHEERKHRKKKKK